MAYFLKGRGLSALASYGAGLFLGFCGYWLTLFSAGHFGWFHWMAFGPFSFGLIDRIVRKGKIRSYLLLGAVMAWSCFYQSDLWFLFALFIGAYFVWAHFREKKRPEIRKLSLCILVFVSVGLPGFLSAFSDLAFRDKQIEESSSKAVDSKQSDFERWIFVTNWSLPPDEISEFLIPRVNGDTSCSMVLSLGRQQHTGVRQYTGALGRPYNATAGNYRQHSLYVGFVTCIFAVFGLISIFFKDESRNRGEKIFFAAAAILCCLLSFGRYFEALYKMVYALPVGNYLRAPVKWHHLTEFSLVVLSGFGVEFFYKRLLKAVNVKIARAIVCVIVAAGAINLVSVAKLYCAAVDLTVVRSQNPAAVDMIEKGGGKLADVMSGGSGLVAWSFSSYGLNVVRNPVEEDVRFIWAGIEQLNNRAFSEWVKSKKAKPIGLYTLTKRGVFRAGRAGANMALLEIPDVDLHPRAERFPEFSFITLAGVFSVLASLFVVLFATGASFFDRFR